MARPTFIGEPLSSGSSLGGSPVGGSFLDGGVFEGSRCGGFFGSGSRIGARLFIN